MKKQAKHVEYAELFILLLVFLFARISLRILNVANRSIVENTNIKEFAQNRNITKSILIANRGSILDANGEKLAHNVTAYTVIAYLDSSRTTNPKFPKHVVDKDLTATELAKHINMSKESILSLLNRNVYQVELGPGGRDITELTKQNIEKLDLPGISFLKATKRDYPNSQFASYILGYVQKNDQGELIGEMGIEKFYDKQLKGIDGYKEYQKDRAGFQIPDTPYKEIKAQSGKDIYLTIDSNVQIFLENALNNLVDKYSPEWGLITVMDAKTGAIVGSATTPTFDPNKKNITNYNNPLTSYTYEPGSTMKIFSFMAAMENNVYDGSEKYKSGTIKVADSIIKDANNVGWGTISFDQGFTYSSNVAATMLGQKIGKDKLKDYYIKLGFGKKTNIELAGELNGIINFNYKVELANASFGQGITVTPIQMLQAMTAITNDGVMLKPYIIEKIIDPNTNEVIYKNTRKEIETVASKETINHLINLMDETVNGEDENITARAFKTDLIEVIGKTGTAQTVGPNGKYLTGKYDYVRSFIGAFPKKDPEYIIYIVTNKLKGYNRNLGETIREIIENISKNKYLLDIETNLNNQDQFLMPQLVNKKLNDTIEIIDKLTNNYIILGDGDYIIDQYPKFNTKIFKDNKIFVLTNSNSIKMPKIFNWSSTDVVNLCNIIGLKYEFNDYGQVINSSIKEDTIIDKKMILVVDLQPK